MKNKYFLLLLLISFFSFNQAKAQEVQSNLNVLVSTIEQQPIVLLTVSEVIINNDDVMRFTPSIALSKRSFKLKVNLKLQGKIDLFKIKRHTKTC